MQPVNHGTPIVIVNQPNQQKEWSFKKSCVGKVLMVFFHILTLGCFLQGPKIQKTVTYIEPMYDRRRNLAQPTRTVYLSSLDDMQHVNSHAAPNYQQSQHVRATHNPRPTEVPFNMLRGNLNPSAPSQINAGISHNPRPTEVPFGMVRK